ncbi:hypothetical protein FHS60_001566 [Alloprevotella rava]|uniref:Uncharacterized protein n=1 Tax=Alloprevotella rava TaxID=671218 RepID=A0A7W5UKC5_9BACT|nr:hypothetical protein [Alloprevotella rava]
MKEKIIIYRQDSKDYFATKERGILDINTPFFLNFHLILGLLVS